MLLMAAAGANHRSRPQQQVGSPVASSSSSSIGASAAAAVNSLQQQQQQLGQLGKSSNSSNETVIALDQTTATATNTTRPQANSSSSKSDATQQTDEDEKMTNCNQDPASISRREETAAPTTTTTTAGSTEEQDKQQQQPQPTSRRLRNFYLHTWAHLSGPFGGGGGGGGGQTPNQSPSKTKRTKEQQQPRKQSLDCEQTTDRQPRNESSPAPEAAHRQKKFVNLFNLAQRCFFFHKQSSEFSLEHHTTAAAGDLLGSPPNDEISMKPNGKCRSAPVTPIKWNSLASSAAAAPVQLDDDATRSAAAAKQEPGLGSTSAASATKHHNKPSVRFVEQSTAAPSGNRRPTQVQSEQESKRSSSKWRAVHTQTSDIISGQQTPTNDSSVANLFKLQDVVEEGESPMNSTSFRQHGYSLIDYISNYLDTIKERRVTPLNIEPGYLKDLIEPSAPATGESFANIMHDFENHIMCGITHWQHPHFHAYFPAGNAYPSILADMLSDALGCVGFSWAASPAYTELEIIMLDWMGKMIGLPDEFLCLSGGGASADEEAAAADSGKGQSKGGGVIQGSASECVLVNLLAARHWAIDKLRKKYPQTPDGILLTKLIGYCSKEAHSCVEKAAMIGFIRMRALDTDEQHSLRGETLAKAIAMDKANGLEPFLVCATLGTTSCVSFDNLAELGPVCRDEDIWLHVDAAYAGSALICPEFQYLMKGIELVTSFNMNPNKWMLINFDCSLMWVKDRFKLTRAFVVDPLYLQHSFSDQAIDYRHWGIPLSRRFRALKLWFVIRNYGVAGLQAYIRNHVRLAKLFEQLIRQDSRFTINNQVVLGLVCFRLIGSNALNQRLLSMINASGKLHMVPASLEGRYVIRFCVCDQNAKEEDIRFAYECIAQFATELFEGIRAGRERIRAISQQNTIDVSNVSLHTQQSASADRLNRMATAHQSTSSGASIPLLSSEASVAAPGEPADAADQPQLQQQQRLTASPNREAARQYLMASRRNSHALNGDSEPAPPGGATSSQHQATPSPADGVNLEDLEQEIAIDSLASIDGLDYDLDEEEDDDDDDDDLIAETPDGADGASTTGAGEVDGEQQQQQQEHKQLNRSNSSNYSNRSSSQRRRLKSSHTLTATSATGERDEAEDEVSFHLAKERQNRMSLRYKREFFVRVVSDPRVYRASISGDINASCNSLGQQQQQAPVGPTVTSAAEQRN